MIVLPIRNSRHAGLRDALIAKLKPAQLVSVQEVPWASITFSGARHIFVFELTGQAAEERGNAFAARASCEEFDVKGQLVADLIVTSCTHGPNGTCVTIEALTVEAV